jgi:hypothetical protein
MFHWQSKGGITCVPSVSVADNALIAVALLLMEYLLWITSFYCWWVCFPIGMVKLLDLHLLLLLSVAVKVKVVVL